MTGSTSQSEAGGGGAPRIPAHPHTCSLVLGRLTPPRTHSSCLDKMEISEEFPGKHTWLCCPGLLLTQTQYREGQPKGVPLFVGDGRCPLSV